MANINDHMICTVCEEVFSYRSQCPVCGSRSIQPLSRFSPVVTDIPPRATLQTNRPTLVEFLNVRV